MRYLKILITGMVALMLSNCQQDDPAANLPGQVAFSLRIHDRMNLSGKGMEDNTPAFAHYTLKDKDGAMITSKMELYTFSGSYTTSPQTLATGRYELHQLLILTANNKVVYAAPLSGSPLAYLVNHPLPIVFDITADEVTSVVPEVLSIDNSTPGDFGYVAFGFDILKPDLSGLFAFDYVYQPVDIHINGIQKDSYSRLKKTGSHTAGWDMASSFENSRIRMLYRRDAQGILSGADYFDISDGFRKIRSVDFEYGGDYAAPAKAHVSAWSEAGELKIFDIVFEYSEGRIKKLHHENFAVPAHGHYHVFIDLTLHYNAAADIVEANWYGESRHINSPSQNNNTHQMDRLYEYSTDQSIFSPEFDFVKTICLYVMNFSHDRGLAFTRPFNFELIPKIFSAHNYVKSMQKPRDWEGPEVGRKSSEHIRKLFYNSEGRPVSAINEIFFADLESGPGAPLKSLMAAELFKADQ